MPRVRRMRPGPFRSSRRKIQASGVLDALIEYAEGRREMSPRQVSVALGLVKQALSDPSAEAPPEEIDRDAKPAPQKDQIEIRIVDPQR